MAAVRAEDTPRPRPRPASGPAGEVAAETTGEPSSTATRSAPSDAGRSVIRPVRWRGRVPSLRDAAESGRRLARTEPPPPGQMVAATSGAVVTAARVGRLLGRSYWRMAKQLPGVTTLEAQAERLLRTATSELGRMLEMPQQLAGPGNPEEQRVMMLVRNAGGDPEPLRTAMSELLERSSEADGEQSREYLFGSIVSQLVPDEARLLAALATGRAFAAVDVLAKPNGRSGRNRVVLANISTVGTAAGIPVPTNAATYLTRLAGFGLVDFTHNPARLESQFDSLLRDPAVAAARSSIEAGRDASAKIVRKSVTLSALGHEFWTACAPARGSFGRRTS